MVVSEGEKCEIPQTTSDLAKTRELSAQLVPTKGPSGILPKIQVSDFFVFFVVFVGL